MAQAPEVALVGVKPLFRDLKRLGADTGPLAKAFSAAGKKAVAPIADAVRARLPVSDRTDRWTKPGRLAADVRTNATRTGATVRMGRASLRYAGWIEFGGDLKNPHPATRDYVKGGRYLFPAAQALTAAAAEDYAIAAQAALDAFDWTNITTDGSAVHD
jgi:hypothetical protein